MAEKFEDVEFVEYVVKSLVPHPDDVKVERKVDEMGVLVTLTVNPDDMGYVIGKQGQTAKALRTLLKIIGAKNNARINFRINDTRGGAPRAPKADVDTDVVDDLKI